MKRFSLRYTLLTFRLDQLWMPAGFWALFAVICLFKNEPDFVYDTARAYLGTVVPLIGGILAAYALLDDPGLELRFATAERAWQFLLERLGLIFVLQMVNALSFQIFALLMGADFSQMGGWAAPQLAWLVPTLTLISLGCAVSLLARQTMSGAFVVGIVWLVELLARGWFARNNGKYILVFMSALMPDHPSLHANQFTLFVLSIVLLLASWLLLRRQERYI